MKKLSLITMIAAVVCCSFIAGKSLLVNGPKLRLISYSKSSQHLIDDNTNQLPKSYVNRKFLTDASNISLDVFSIPGNLVSYDAKDSTYGIRTLHSLIKGDKLPAISPIKDGLIYSGFVNSQTSFNGSHLIGGISAKQGEVVEISIQDESIAAVPDTLIDIPKLKEALASVSSNDLENLFYVKSVTLSSINNRLFKQSKFDATKNGLYLVFNGKTYASDEKPGKQRLVSMYLVPVKNLTTNR